MVFSLAMYCAIPCCVKGGTFPNGGVFLSLAAYCDIPCCVKGGTPPYVVGTDCAPNAVAVKGVMRGAPVVLTFDKRGGNMALGAPKLPAAAVAGLEAGGT